MRVILLLAMSLHLVSSSKDWREKDVLEYTDKDFDLLGKQTEYAKAVSRTFLSHLVDKVQNLKKQNMIFKNINQSTDAVKKQCRKLNSVDRPHFFHFACEKSRVR
jgi:hypothetical protein